MKIFLITSIVAMMSAGIYGTVDLAKDINQGTLIQYDKEDIRGIKSFTATNKNLSQRAGTIKVETKKEEKVTKPNVSDLKMEYFSRGEPPYFPNLEELAILDSAAKAADSSTVISGSSTAAEKVEAEKATAVLPKTEERKLSAKLFSRGRPRPVIKEIAVAQTDTAKKQ